MTVSGEGNRDAAPISTSALGTLRQHSRALTVVALLTVAGCAAGTWWQVERALDGNLLSKFYEFLWPFYGCYVIYVWRRLGRGANTLIGHEAAADPEPEAEDLELLAYNRYLATKRADAQRRGH